MGSHRYGQNPRNAHDVLAALKSFLFCPHCGSSEIPLGTYKKSQSAFTLQCRGKCNLKFYVRRADLAEAAMHKANETDDPAQRDLYERVAALFAGDAVARHLYPAEAPR